MHPVASRARPDHQLHAAAGGPAGRRAAAALAPAALAVRLARDVTRARLPWCHASRVTRHACLPSVGRVVRAAVLCT